jgi:OOP family OmpA-OmpF porin
MADRDVEHGAPKKRRRMGLLPWAAALACVAVAVPPSPDAQTSAQPPSMSASAPEAARGTHRGPETDGVTFGQALLREYGALIVSESRSYQAEFDRAHFDRKIQALSQGEVPAPDRPRAVGVAGPAAVAQGEARARLVRLFDLGARERWPTLTARAQVELECWMFRTAARIGRDGIADCEARFAATTRQIEDAVLPLRTASEFSRTLVREYLAYAAYEGTDGGDFIDSRHFAAKAVRAAEAEKPAEVEPEIVSRWPLADQREAQIFGQWRARLAKALDAHREGKLAAVAAVAQVRFDCWIERASERADADHVNRCRGEFVTALRALEGLAQEPPVRVEVGFDLDRANLRHAERGRIETAARLAVARDAQSVSVVASAEGMGRESFVARLALRRAEVVAAELARLGVPPERIRVMHAAPVERALPRAAGLRRAGDQRAAIVIE